MKLKHITPVIIGLCLLVVFPCCDRKKNQNADHPGNLRLLYWNIQNGMWDGQDDNFDRFTAWTRAQDPDICVWCESQPIYKSGTAEKLDDIDTWRTDPPLLEFWKEMAARYGHNYVFLGGHRDNYPQVITSKYPIREKARIIGNQADSVVSHGCGWATVEIEGRTLNIVSLHTWPQAYGLDVPKEDRERSKAAHEGDRFRRLEMEYICRHTILTSEAPAQEYWMMMGDFNSRSRKDNWVYQYPDDDTRLLVHDYILSETPYLDVIAERYPENFYSSTGGHARIDYVYCTKPLFDTIVDAKIITDDYTRPVRDAKKISNFWHPSDHRPILVDFEIK